MPNLSGSLNSFWGAAWCIKGPYSGAKLEAPVIPVEPDVHDGGDEVYRLVGVGLVTGVTANTHKRHPPKRMLMAMDRRTNSELTADPVINLHTGSRASSRRGTCAIKHSVPTRHEQASDSRSGKIFQIICHSTVS